MPDKVALAVGAGGVIGGNLVGHLQTLWGLACDWPVAAGRVNAVFAYAALRITS
jgi:hypothetical protein